MGYAHTEINVSPLHSEFGESLARKWFGDEIVNMLPRYVKGKNKGRIKGWLKWRKCIHGGWFALNGFRGVIKPNMIIEKWIELDYEIMLGKDIYQCMRELKDPNEAEEWIKTWFGYRQCAIADGHRLPF